MRKQALTAFICCLALLLIGTLYIGSQSSSTRSKFQQTLSCPQNAELIDGKCYSICRRGFRSTLSNCYSCRNHFNPFNETHCSRTVRGVATYNSVVISSRTVSNPVNTPPIVAVPTGSVSAAVVNSAGTLTVVTSKKNRD